MNTKITSPTFSLALILLLALGITLGLSQTADMAALEANVFASPQSPLPSPGSGGGKGGNDEKEKDDDDTPHSAIEGFVTDLSTGRPGAGLWLDIEGRLVTTDWLGHYSLTGLGAETLQVRLLLDAGQGVAAQEPMRVKLDGIHPERVDLGFYSAPLPAPTATLPPPQVLPETGGERP